MPAAAEPPARPDPAIGDRGAAGDRPPAAAVPPATVPQEPGGPLADATWPDVARWAATCLLAVPVGSTEQHGPHLPLGTDTMVAEALAEALAGRRPDVVVAPAVAYGASGEHGTFPGTLSIGTDATAALLIELIRSADAFRGVVLVSAHGGNAEALDRARRTADAEGRSVLAWSPAADRLAAVAAEHGAAADAHAGWVETSIILAVRPDTVRPGAARAGNTEPLSVLAGRLKQGGVGAVSTNGVLGDPAAAHATAGRALLGALSDALAAAVADRWGPPTGGAAPPPGAPPAR